MYHTQNTINDNREAKIIWDVVVCEAKIIHEQNYDHDVERITLYDHNDHKILKNRSMNMTVRLQLMLIILSSNHIKDVQYDTNLSISDRIVNFTKIKLVHYDHNNKK